MIKQPRIEVELIKRQSTTSIYLKFFLFAGVYALLRFGLGIKFRLQYSSKLIALTNGFIPKDSVWYFVISLFLLLFLIFVYPILIWVFTFLKIRGTVIITPEQIEIIHFKKYHYKFNLAQLKNIDVQFNHFKRNDEEPRSIIDGSNNIISFKRLQVPFSFEFLLQTIQEDDEFREILDYWIQKGYINNYRTTLAEPN